MNQILLQLKNSGKFPDNSLYLRLRSTDAAIPPIFGSIKVHKNDYPLRPIVSFCSSPTYNLSKYLASIISPIRGNPATTVINSAKFCDFLKSVTIPPDHEMVSFDVVSLFTSIPVELAVSVTKERLAKDDSLVDRTSLSVDEICLLLEFCLKATEFTFQKDFYRQVFGCAMGSPVSALMADIVMEDVESRILSHRNFSVMVWKRYVDDTWVLLPRDKVREFYSFINTVEPSIKFTMEKEVDGSIAFLDVLIQRTNNGRPDFSVYRKPTHTGKYLDFTSYHPPCHKRSVVRSLMDRASSHTSNALEMQKEQRKVRSDLLRNGYPFGFIEKKTKKNSNTQEVKGRMILPYVKGVTDRLGRILKKFDLGVYFKPSRKLSAALHAPKDRPSKEKTKGVVYRIPCKDCDQCYIGQTGNSFDMRIKQHKAALRLMQEEKSAVASHALNHDHHIGWEEAEILKQQSDYRKRMFSETWHIEKTVNFNRIETFLPAVYKVLT